MLPARGRHERYRHRGGHQQWSVVDPHCDAGERVLPRDFRDQRPRLWTGCGADLSRFCSRGAGWFSTRGELASGDSGRHSGLLRNRGRPRGSASRQRRRAESSDAILTSNHRLDRRSARTPQFAGLSGSFVALNQINVAVPAGVPTGASVPLQIQSGGITTTDKITIAIQGPPTQLTLQSMTVSPTSVTGGQSATGTITLSGSAPSGGVDVQVSLGTQAPVAIRVAAGQTSATFQINTVAVTSSTALTITAALNGVQRTATLTVLPATLQSVTVNPTSLTGGQSATGTITLSGLAPSGGVERPG